MAASISFDGWLTFFGPLEGFEPCLRASEMSAFYAFRESNGFRAFFDCLG
jgi:hypothetical protein